MSRIYPITFKLVSITGPIDLVQINGATGKSLRIIHRAIGCVELNAPTQQDIQLTDHLMTATVTNGSGGTSVSPIPKMDPGDAAASFAAWTCNTTRATTTGTDTTLFATGVHIFNGYDDVPLGFPPIGPGETYLFGLDTVGGGALTGGPYHFTCTVKVEESGG